MKDKETYMSVKEYASKHKVSVQNIYQQIKKGKLEGKKIGSFQLVKVQ